MKSLNSEAPFQIQRAGCRWTSILHRHDCDCRQSRLSIWPLSIHMDNPQSAVFRVCIFHQLHSQWLQCCSVYEVSLYQAEYVQIWMNSSYCRTYTRGPDILWKRRRTSSAFWLCKMQTRVHFRRPGSLDIHWWQLRTGFAVFDMIILCYHRHG